MQSYHHIAHYHTIILIFENMFLSNNTITFFKLLATAYYVKYWNQRKLIKETLSISIAIWDQKSKKLFKLIYIIISFERFFKCLSGTFNEKNELRNWFFEYENPNHLFIYQAILTAKNAK